MSVIKAPRLTDVRMSPRTLPDQAEELEEAPPSPKEKESFGKKFAGVLQKHTVIGGSRGVMGLVSKAKAKRARSSMTELQRMTVDSETQAQRDAYKERDAGLTPKLKKTRKELVAEDIARFHHQLLVRMLAGGLFVYVIAACALLGAAGFMYFGAVDNERQRYMTSAVVPRLQQQLVVEISSAARVRDALHYAVLRRLYADPLDYAVVGRLVGPLFEQSPLVTSVELAFADRPATIMVARQPDGSVTLQSDAPDCYRIDVHGCMRKIYPEINGTKMSHYLDWYQKAELLEASEGSAPNELWLGPDITLDESKKVTRTRTEDDVRWTIAYALVFRTVFRDTGGANWVVGRVELQLSLLNEALKDAVLRNGGKDRLYLVTEEGRLIIGAKPADSIEVTGSTITAGKITNYKAEWKKGWSAADHRQLASLLVTEGTATMGSVLVTVARLSEGQQFFLVCVSETEPFVHAPMQLVAYLGWAAAILPFALPMVLKLLDEHHGWRLRQRDRAHMRHLAELEAEAALEEATRKPLVKASMNDAVPKTGKLKGKLKAKIREQQAAKALANKSASGGKKAPEGATATDG